MIGWAAPALAGAWTKEVGEAYAKAHADVYGTLRYVAADVEPGGAYVGQQYGVYGEVGVLPGWRGQLNVALPLVVGTHHAVYADPFGTNDVRATTVRAGDLRVAAQVALHRERPLALAVDLKLPAYANDRVGDAYPLYRALFPKPGDGQVDLGVMLSAGATPWGGGFVEVGVGFVHRTEVFVGWDTDLAFTDGARLVAKGGHDLGRVLPIVTVDGVVSPAASPTTRSVVTVAASAMIELTPDLALEPRLVGDLWTHHASRGAGGGVGLSWRR